MAALKNEQNGSTENKNLDYQVTNKSDEPIVSQNVQKWV